MDFDACHPKSRWGKTLLNSERACCTERHPLGVSSRRAFEHPLQHYRPPRVIRSHDPFLITGHDYITPSKSSGLLTRRTIKPTRNEGIPASTQDVCRSVHPTLFHFFYLSEHSVRLFLINGLSPQITSYVVVEVLLNVPGVDLYVYLVPRPPQAIKDLGPIRHTWF